MPRSPLSLRLHRIFAKQLATEAGFDPSRRKFIQASSVAAAALACRPVRAFAGGSVGEILGQRKGTVAIVGAGAAGLAAAYRLRKQGIPFRIFEGSERVGGRIYTDYEKFAGQGQFCERGGELINSDHHSIREFAKELGVELQEFSDADLNAFSDTFYFGGRAYSEAEVAEASVPLMHAVLRDNKAIYGEAEQVPITFDCPHAESASRFDRLSLAEYLDSIPDLAPWLKEIVKIGYEADSGIPAEEQSVLLLFSYFTGTQPEDFRVFGSSDETTRIRGGNSRLIEAAFRAIGGRSVTSFGHKLDRVRDLGGKLELTFSTPTGAKSYSFDQVVLAIPFTKLRLVEGFEDRTLTGIDERVMKSIHELKYGSNSKMMLGFNRRVWREDLKASGMAISDLYTCNTWETSRGQNGEKGILTFYAPGHRAYVVSTADIPRIMNDLEKLFPGSTAHYNERVLVHIWPANPFLEASYSSPAPGQFTTIVGACAQPQMSSRLFLAGEQTAPYYFGYMEGAVESGLRVAAQIHQSRTHG